MGALKAGKLALDVTSLVDVAMPRCMSVEEALASLRCCVIEVEGTSLKGYGHNH